MKMLKKKYAKRNMQKEICKKKHAKRTCKKKYAKKKYSEKIKNDILNMLYSKTKYSRRQ